MNEIVVQSRDVLSKHARSFRWASQFLPSDRRDDAAVVYAFCRLVDDIADESDDAEIARVELDRLCEEVKQTRAPRPLVTAFLEVCNRREIDTIYALELIAGVQSDLGEVRFQDREEFYRYCYRVAGTVGLMMCSVLGVRDPHAHAHAVDLGVAMQITNICRDVLEDAQIGRVYLPANILAVAGISQQSILDGNVDRGKLAGVISKLLVEADRYYESADHGMKYIPRRSRLAILVASRLYRAIGVKLAENGSDPMMGRTFVTGTEKAGLVLRAFGTYLTPRMMSRFAARYVCRHDATLHLPLRGLPGTNHQLLID